MAGLDLYRAKRDFTRTGEPEGAPQSKSGKAQARKAHGGAFVVHKHAARRLHYDLRLEHDGVLWSWAVTRGPSLDPDEKRLAVHVEDHPLEYGSFEGTIPEGQYGAGSVIVWDEGRWVPEGDPAFGLEKGHLSFMLEGHKLLIFSQFVKHLEIVKEMLKSQEIPFAYLDGSSTDRKEQVERFNKDPDLKIFLISIKAGGLGLNLTEADYVFILDPWWNPAVEAQATDRAHRIGQKKKVFTYKFITKNTVEEKILQLQKHKLKLSENLIQSEESVVKTLTKEDLEMLLN